MSAPSDLALFFGRLHPLLVHLPIGLVVLLAFLELLARSDRFRTANANASLILALAVPLALLTVLCGWLLSLAGGYETRLLQWHKWTGIGTAAACALAGLLYRLGQKKLYRCSLFAAVAVLAVASHFGGSLTHGSDYLVRYAPKGLRTLLGASARAQPGPAKDFGQLPAFAGLIQPVLEQNCVSCHGPEKAKGRLRLDTLEALLQGGTAGLAVLPGKAAQSPLLKRLRLPVAEEEHMPPEGKPQPTAEEMVLLEWWIDAGAPANKRAGELKPPANVTRILEARSNKSDFGTRQGFR